MKDTKITLLHEKSKLEQNQVEWNESHAWSSLFLIFDNSIWLGCRSHDQVILKNFFALDKKINRKIKFSYVLPVNDLEWITFYIKQEQ